MVTENESPLVDAKKHSFLMFFQVFHSLAHCTNRAVVEESETFCELNICKKQMSFEMNQKEDIVRIP